MRHKLLDIAEQSSLREKPLNFEVGDTVEVHTRILEGDKERIQIFSGVVIARRGRGMAEMFTVRRIVAGEGVERTFPVNSPKVAEVVTKRHAKVRRAKLFYLRDRVGKATRLTERRARAGEAETTS
ncbi:50S ribosomal protein L19 [Planctomicrobium sp. SH661]|uniref:50S ribosomal protein L19 n=1 Tax=Planctomicrobium sp. SH661 TaxID=3448124 RepID=UPI003F5BED94